MVYRIGGVSRVILQMFVINFIVFVKIGGSEHEQHEGGSNSDPLLP